MYMPKLDRQQEGFLRRREIELERKRKKVWIPSGGGESKNHANDAGFVHQVIYS